MNEDCLPRLALLFNEFDLPVQPNQGWWWRRVWNGFPPMNDRAIFILDLGQTQDRARVGWRLGNPSTYVDACLYEGPVVFCTCIIVVAEEPRAACDTP